MTRHRASYFFMIVAVTTVGIASVQAAEDSYADSRVVAGVQIGIPLGGALYAMIAPNKYLSVGPYISHLRLNATFNDFDLWKFGGRARWHWNGHAPRGGYLFADAAYANGRFKRDPAGSTFISEKTDAFQWLFGIGGQFRFYERLCLDMGFGAGPKVEFHRQTTSGRSSVSSGGVLYIGLGVLL